MPDASTIVDVLQSLDPLSSLQRTGYVIRGVPQAETIAAHSYAVAVLAMLFVDHLRAQGETVDGERVLRMALLHDTPESKTGDMPMPFKTGAAEEALSEIEASIARTSLTPEQATLWEEADRGETLEARIVKAADKAQMMIKVLTYEQHGQGELSDFWVNPKNFRHCDLEVARAVYQEVCRRAGRESLI